MHILMQHSRLHDEETPNVVSTSHDSQQPLPNVSQEVVQEPLSSKRGFTRRRETNFCPYCPYKSKHNCDMKAHLKVNTIIKLV